MIALAIAFAALTSPAAGLPWSTPSQPVGRVITTPTVHLGVRTALLLSPAEQATGITVQLTLNVL